VKKVTVRKIIMNATREENALLQKDNCLNITKHISQKLLVSMMSRRIVSASMNF